MILNCNNASCVQNPSDPNTVTQEQMYGRKMRVFNLLKDKTRARCTVCGAEREVPKEKS
jgi:hypothetical protein